MMSLSVHAMTTEPFIHMLGNLSNILGKAAAHAEAKKIESGVLEGLRVTPDMFTLARQVMLTCDFAKNSCARLAGVEPPRFEDTEKTLAELQGRIAKTIDYLKTLTPAQMEGAEQRKITLPLRTRTLEMDGLPFIRKWTIPNFYFHLTTTYALLRGVGVDIGKQDFLGGY
jgi:hypothetical protein